MKKAKVSVALLAAAMLSLSAVVSANENVSSKASLLQSATQATESNIIVKGYDEAVFYPLDAILLNSVHHTGNTAYTGKFTTAPANGKNLNVWVKNNSSSTVYMTISRNGSEFVSDIAISAGSQKTQTFSEQVASGLSGDWEVYVYNKNGARYDLNINARQY